MKALYALVPDPASAQRVVDALRRASTDLGFDANQIVVQSGEPHEGYDFSNEHAKTWIWHLATLGAFVGGLTGYALTTLSQKAYPLPTGGMPITPIWTNGIIVYELTMLGAIVTTLVTLLITAGLPNFKTHITDPEVWEGKILVGVEDPPESAATELGNRFRQAGVTQVKQFPGPSVR
jgi:hypothetical protein